MTMIDTMYSRWTNPETRPKFIHGELIDKKTGCCCAQGDVLRCNGRSDYYIAQSVQEYVDEEISEILKIPIWQAVLLRSVNDSKIGCPEAVLKIRETENAQKVFGKHSSEIMEFIEFLENLTPKQKSLLMQGEKIQIIYFNSKKKKDGEHVQDRLLREVFYYYLFSNLQSSNHELSEFVYLVGEPTLLSKTKTTIFEAISCKDKFVGFEIPGNYRYFDIKKNRSRIIRYYPASIHNGS